MVEAVGIEGWRGLGAYLKVEEGEAAGQVEERLARKECRGFLLE